MAQVKNEEEKKKETTKKVTKKSTTNGKNTTKETASKIKSETTNKQTTSKKASATTNKAKATKATKKENEEKTKKVEEKANTEVKSEKKPKAKSTKTEKSKSNKSKTSKGKNAKTSTAKNKKGKITKIVASKKHEEIEEDDAIITDANESSNEVTKIDDAEKMQLVEEEVKKDLKSKNKLPKEQEKKLSSVVFENLCVAIAFMLYLFFVILGFINIKEDVYVVDLKVFSFILLAIAILLFERAYKKDSGKLCAYGIETLFLAIATMSFLYVNIEIKNMFLPIVAIISLLFAIYYVAKSIYLYTKSKKKYFVDNMRDIMQKEEKE